MDGGRIGRSEVSVVEVDDALEATREYVDDYLASGLDPEDIAVVSPYDDQVDRIEDELDGATPERPQGGSGDGEALGASGRSSWQSPREKAADTEDAAASVGVDTVDGFQGREKEVVLVSLVRSNDRGEVGFLDEPRRFNVSLTRARRKAVVVGDADTVTEADVYQDFEAYARREGRVVRFEDAV